MAKTLIQNTPEFPGLGGKKFHPGDRIEFNHGLVDIHTHGRDNNAALGNGMTDILYHSARQFGLVLLMPNLVGKDALMTPEMATAYYTRALAAAKVPPGQFQMVVTVYLNTDLTEDDIKMVADSSHIAGIKSYPAHGTTNSEHGLRTPLLATKQLEWMEKHGVRLLVHGQTRVREDGTVMDEYDRSHYFYNEVAPELDRRHPELRISYEHLDTAVGAQAVLERKGPTQGTFTILHLGYTRTDVMDSGVRTDMVMKPMVQHERQMSGIWEAFREAPERFALGSDDAWHQITAKHAKNVACGGCYGPYRLGNYLDVFEARGALDLFGRFACVNAANFYGLEVPERTITLEKSDYWVEETLSFGDHRAEPLHAGEDRMGWHLV